MINVHGRFLQISHIQPSYLLKIILDGCLQIEEITTYNREAKCNLGNML